MKKEKDLYQVSLKLFLKNKNGEVLCLKGAEWGSFAGYYDLPGGRIDADEFRKDFLEILKREVTEEIGNDNFTINPAPFGISRHLIPASIIKSAKDVHVLLVFYKGDYNGDQINISSEHEGYKWINLKEIELEKYFKSGILEGIKIYLGK